MNKKVIFDKKTGLYVANKYQTLNSGKIIKCNKGLLKYREGAASGMNRLYKLIRGI